MKYIIIAIICLMASSGCASFSSDLKETQILEVRKHSFRYTNFTVNYPTFEIVYDLYKDEIILILKDKKTKVIIKQEA